MLIDAAPPVEKSPAAQTDPDTYAYSANPSSFVTVLSELNNAADDSARDNAPEDIDRVNVESVDEHAVAEEDQDATETEDVAETDTPSSDERPNAELTDEFVAPSAEFGEAEFSGNEEPVLTEVPAETNSNERNTREQPTVVNTTDTAAVPVATQQPPTSPLTPTTHTAASTEGVSTDVSQDGEGPSPGDGNLPSKSFPKTLNALLAEKAVKTDEAPGFRASNVISEKESGSTERLLRPVVSDDVAVDPPPTPPQATTTELGGVRLPAQAPTPRIPLSNLPGEIVQQIQLIQQQGTSSLRLRIAPENLGELHLEVHRSGDTVRVTMTSASPLVRDALDSQISQLRNALQEQGLELSEANVEDNPGARDGRGNSSSETTGELDGPFPEASYLNDETAPDTERGATDLGLSGGGLNVLA
jgi:flagellar hook-length control protein FliK